MCRSMMRAYVILVMPVSVPNYLQCIQMIRWSVTRFGYFHLSCQNLEGILVIVEINASLKLLHPQNIVDSIIEQLAY